MATIAGKYEKKYRKQSSSLWFLLIPLSFLLVEVFGFEYMIAQEDLEAPGAWPLAFSVLWSCILSGIVSILPGKAGRISYGIVYLLAVIYAGAQTGYFRMFGEMMWLSEFRYASEGADYFSVLLQYPLSWYGWLLGLVGLGILNMIKFPSWPFRMTRAAIGLAAAAAAICGAAVLPERVFQQDKDIKYAGSDYGRAQSAEAAYDNMFNTYRLYQVCGLYQTAVKDIYANGIYPHTPGYVHAQKTARKEIEGYLETSGPNAMTGCLKGKNVILVLMESMDDWMIGEHTPTIERLMAEGINFTDFYTPVYGGIRTFNTEFCLNTGSYLSSKGGYAFDYVTNSYQQSLANQLRQEGYSAKVFHYNEPSFYSRGEFSEALGYEEYVCYADYLQDLDEQQQKQALYDDLLVFQNPDLRAEFFREGQPKLNFLITRSAHLSYKYNEVLSHWGMKKYPQYKGLTGNEETDCAYLKARLVDDLFRELLTALEQEGQLESTVIIGVTDHYTYGYKDMDSLMELSDVEEELLLERTPCFIWSSDLKPVTVDKTLNTADLLPTLLNLLGIRKEYAYIGSDAFDENYEGFVPFSNGSWISGDVAFDAEQVKILSLSETVHPVSEEFLLETTEMTEDFVDINNLILETNYYRKEKKTPAS